MKIHLLAMVLVAGFLPGRDAGAQPPRALKSSEVVRPQLVSGSLTAPTTSAPNFLAVYSGTIALDEPIVGCTSTGPHVCPDGFQRLELQLDLPAATGRGPQTWVHTAPIGIPTSPMIVIASGAASAAIASINSEGNPGTWAIDEAWIDAEGFPSESNPSVNRSTLVLHLRVAVRGATNNISRLTYNASATGRLIGGAIRH